MAIIRPYADPNAHGSLNNSLTFRRYKNKVILQSLPRPTPGKTPAQLAQRAKLIEANKSFSLLTNATKWFYHKRSSQKETTRKGLYMRAHMRGSLPSTLKPIFCKSIIGMVIFEPSGYYPDNLEISIYNVPPYPSFMLWNKLDEIIGDEVPSINGVPGIIRGDINTVPGKFDNGIQAFAELSGLEFENILIDEEKGLFAWWMKTTEDVIDGYLQNVVNENRIMNINPQSGGCDFYFEAVPQAGRLRFVMPWWAPNLGGDTRATWNAGDWVHFTVAWDKDQTNGWSCAIYLNGEQLINTTNAWQPWTLGGDTYNLLTWSTTPFDDWGKIIIDDLLVSKEISNLESVLENFNTPGAQAIKFYGMIFDNSNEFTKLDNVIDYDTQIIRLSTMAGYSMQVPFRYLISVTWIDQDDEIVNSTIRLPQLTMEALQEIEFFLSRDWSVYWDSTFRRLACASRL